MFDRISYKALNSRQKENYNFHKVAARLTDFGYHSIRLTDDWLGADFIAYHIDGQTFLRVQLKTRFLLDRKYLGKNLHIAFFDRPDLYVYPHDEVYEAFTKSGQLGKNGKTERWEAEGVRSWSSFPGWARKLLIDYKVPNDE